MTLDIIIPAYNAHSTIDRAIASCAMQKLDEGDSMCVVIVDDCSTDGDYHDTALYWANQIDMAVIDKDVNQGCGQARQTGIDQTNGDVFMFLDADDVLGSPFAVRTLMEQMKTGCDVAMGMFVEETEKKTYVNHGMNWIWCHGKMYKREFVQSNNIRFNMTRGNEDAGWHSVMSHLTDNVVYVPQVVYIWEHQNDSTVRGDYKGYSFDYGWRDFVENMAWAKEQMVDRGCNEEDILGFVVIVLNRFYWQFAQAHENFPKKDKQNIEILKDAYDRIARDYVESGKLTFKAISEGYIAMNGDSDYAVVPHLTLEAFLKKIGFKEVDDK